MGVYADSGKDAGRNLAEIRTTSSTGGQKGTKLERFDLIPPGPLAELAHHFGVGAQKYEDHNWRRGYEWSKSYSAVQRHLNAFWGGEDLDECPASGEGCSFVTSEGATFVSKNPGKTCYNHTGNHHLVAAAWHCFALLEFKDRFPEYDDRYKENQWQSDNPPTPSSFGLSRTYPSSQERDDAKRE